MTENSDTKPACGRVSPCASCPYRKNVPSGLWNPTEYAKLPGYDLDTASQSPAAFMCHQGDGAVCAGWLGYADPGELLAVRIGVARGTLDVSCFEYTTDVPLFPSGADAAAHGLREVDAPGEAASVAIDKLIRSRDLRSGEAGSATE